MLIDISKLPLAADLFAEQQLVPTLPEGLQREAFRWMTAGVLALTGNQVLQPYMPMLQAQGVVVDGKLDTAKLKIFLDAAFGKQPTMTCPLFGHRFTVGAADGEAFLSILEGLT